MKPKGRESKESKKERKVRGKKRRKGESLGDFVSTLVVLDCLVEVFKDEERNSKHCVGGVCVDFGFMDQER